MEFWHTAILAGAVLLLVSIVASDISSRIGAPLLLVFLGLGMLAGEDGPGGIRFDDFEISWAVGTLALAVIIFDGGLRTRRETFRVALGPAVALATFGVLITAALVSLCAAWALGVSWLEGLLLGAIVGSTDAAAVFALLRTQGAALKRRVAATLEIESGSNDPMAVFLTVAVLEVLAAGRTQFDVSVLASFLLQFGLGAAFGLAGGAALAWLINRLTLATGLYPLLAAAGGLVIFASCQRLGGSGYLAIYLAGLVLGNARLRSAQIVLRVHDGLAWLSQIVMFLILGLLVTPSQLLHIIPQALLIAAGLMLIARPAAVAATLAPFRFPWREQLYIGWVGLRGAVPIVLALFPMMYGLDNARLYFNVTFFVVLVSLLAQGWTIAPAARWLGLEVPPRQEPVQRIPLDVPGHFEYEMVAFDAREGSLATGRTLQEMGLAAGMQVMALIRDGLPIALRPDLAIAPGDHVYFIARPEEVERLAELFDARQVPDRLEEHRYFGDFLLHGETVLGELASVYGFAVPQALERKTVADYLNETLHGRVVVGDRVVLGPVELVVRELRAGRVARVGLRLPRAQAGK
ncbi:MAG: potassium/proton antiporter [Pseudomonadota bacterium]